VNARVACRFSSGGIVVLLHLYVTIVAGLIFFSCAKWTGAQMITPALNENSGQHTREAKPALMDNKILAHVLFDQLEGRSNGTGSLLRWDSEGWVGTDMNRIWMKSEGSIDNSTVSDGDHELLYDRPIPRLRYFDVQAGLREDVDSGPRRAWGAVGIEGLAPYFFQFQPTLYFRGGGHLAARLSGLYDLRLTQRLVVQPELEMNFYTKQDVERRTGPGLSDLDTGIRLRYEISRKFAPYAGFAYTGKYGDSAKLARQAGETAANRSIVFGLRAWY
jgi:copper resistance protein B